MLNGVAFSAVLYGWRFKMTFTLGTNIKAGQQIKTANGWRKVLSVTDAGAETKDGTVKFGETVYGWKAV